MAEAERLVQERPQEGPAQAQPGRCPEIAHERPVGARRLSDSGRGRVATVAPPFTAGRSGVVSVWRGSWCPFGGVQGLSQLNARTALASARTPMLSVEHRVPTFKPRPQVERGDRLTRGSTATETEQGRKLLLACPRPVPPAKRPRKGASHDPRTAAEIRAAMRRRATRPLQCGASRDQPRRADHPHVRPWRDRPRLHAQLVPPRANRGHGASLRRLSTRGSRGSAWIPLGAGGHSVRFNGRVFEAIAAAGQHRRRRDLYHAALVVELEAIVHIERAFAGPDEASRGAVATGAVGSRHAGRLLLFRYEAAAAAAGRSRSRRGGRRAPPAHQRSSGRPPCSTRGDRADAGGGRDELKAGEMGTRTP